MFKLKALLFAFACLVAGAAFGQVEVNTADQAALDGIRGIGPKLSRTILDERKQGGAFKDWGDFEKRVDGVGAKSSDKMSRSGLLVNGQSKPGAAPTPPKSAAPASQPASK